ncbi:MAG: hypothetical protein WBB73_00210, partial [Candidatus Aminicenantaceae bacterium]
MSKKVIMITLGLMFIIQGTLVPQIPQDQKARVIKSGVRTRNLLEAESVMAPLALKPDKARVLLFGASVWTYYFDDPDLYFGNCIKLSEAEIIAFMVDFTAVLNTRVKFHYMFTGPEVWSYTDDIWYDAKYKTCDYHYIETNNVWKKGTYRM